jgi:hypothetical protein
LLGGPAPLQIAARVTGAIATGVPKFDGVKIDYELVKAP